MHGNEVLHEVNRISAGLLPLLDMVVLGDIENGAEDGIDDVLDSFCAFQTVVAIHRLEESEYWPAVVVWLAGSECVHHFAVRWLARDPRIAS